MPAEISTRAFLLGDYENACAIWGSTDGVEICEGDSREEIARYLARNPGLSCVAEENEKLVGAALCGHDGRRGILYHVAVAPEARGRGVGRALVEYCLRGLTAAGVPRVIILVASENSLGYDFWRKNGWEEIEGAVGMTRELPRSEKT